MAKQVIRFRCIGINEIERAVEAADPGEAPHRFITRKVSLSEADAKGDSFIQLVIMGGSQYQVGEEFFVTITPVPKERAPRR